MGKQKQTEEKKKGPSILKIIRDMFALFTPKEKGGFLVQFILGLGNSLAEVISIGAVLPFMYVILDAEKAKTYPILRDIYASSWVQNDSRGFILFIAVAFFVIYSLRCAYMIASSVLSSRISQKINTKYSILLYEYYLTRPYEFFFEHNTSTLHRRIGMMTSSLIGGVVGGTMSLILQVLMIALLLVTIFVTGTPTVLALSGILLAVFAALYFYTQKKSKEISYQSNAIGRELYRTMFEYLRGIKALRVLGRSTSTTGGVWEKNKEINRLRIKYSLVMRFPKIILELGTVGILIFILVATFFQTGSLQESLASISLCGVAALKLRGYLSDTLSTAASIRNNAAFYDEVYEDMKASAQPVPDPGPVIPMTFRETLAVDKVCYRYPGTEEYVLEDASVTVRHGEMVGIMGPSGEGKSTLADLILGLLEPERGKITVDGVPLSSNERGWQAIVGYVPQEIFMMDATIAENVALGIEKDKIDREKVIGTLKAAQLWEFVEGLPDKEDTVIGENGIRLSGGQRQRIGIARALYPDPQVLIFDESTSSLDSKTEKQFVETVNAMRGDYTMLMIAHRKETLVHCDRVLKVSNRQIVG